MAARTSALLTSKTARDRPGFGSASMTGMLQGVCVEAQPSGRKIRSGAACCESCWSPSKRHSMHILRLGQYLHAPAHASYGHANHALRVFTYALPSARGVGRLRAGACADGGGARFRWVLPVSCRLRPFICKCQRSQTILHMQTLFASFAAKRTIWHMHNKPSFRKSVAKFTFHIFHRKLWSIVCKGGD